MTTLQRLLKYPHAAVFNKDPVAEQAFRLRHPGGASWAIAEGVMAVFVSDVESGVFDLSTMTIGELAAALQADGFTVSGLNSTVSGLSAMALVEGDGDEAVSNGDAVFAFTSLLWVLFSAYASEVAAARQQVGEALRQMVITQAEAEWLDVWGTLYGVGRLTGEVDPDYATRIPQEAFRIRVNAFAIEKAIFDLTGYDVRIEEPWRDVFRLDESLLSGPHKFYDGDRIGYHLIQPVSRTPVDWSLVLPIINRNRAAGVIVLGPIVKHAAVVDADLDAQVVSAAASLHTAQERYADRALLDYSDYAETSIVNHKSRYRRDVLHSAHVEVPGQNWGAFNWRPDQNWLLKYVVVGKHARDYRVYYSDLAYAMNWTDLRNWVSIASSWQDAGPLIGSLHTRS